MAQLQVSPPLHPTGARPPKIPPQFVPRHIGLVMDGNGRWANERGLSRNEGHKAGEAALIDVVAGAIEMGVQWVSAYIFSTENWRRTPEEVRFLMGFNRDVLDRNRDVLDAWGVRVRWAGRPGRLWRSVISQLEIAQEQTRRNKVCNLTLCVNYGGRAEIVDAVREIAADAAAGRIKPGAINEKSLRGRLYVPHMPDVDLFIRTSGEQRTSNFLLWESAYAEMVFVPTYWPDMDRLKLWEAIDEYARRDRRYGGAADKPVVQ